MPASARFPVVIGGIMALAGMIAYGQIKPPGAEGTGEKQDSEQTDDERLQFEEPAKLTAKGQSVLDRATAESLIAYGQRHELPEAIVTGVLMLHQHPIEIVRRDGKDKTENVEKKRLRSLLSEAIKLRADDELLKQMVARVRESLEETPRGLASGLQSWDVDIPAGGKFQLDPALRYETRQIAIVDARVIDENGNSANSNAALAISVLGGNMKRPGQVVGQGVVSHQWSASVYESGWIVKVHNLDRQRPVRVRVTAY